MLAFEVALAEHALVRDVDDRLHELGFALEVEERLSGMQAVSNEAIISTEARQLTCERRIGPCGSGSPASSASRTGTTPDLGGSMSKMRLKRQTLPGLAALTTRAAMRSSSGWSDARG